MTGVLKHVVSESPVVELTDAANLRILTYLEKHAQQGLRLSVKKTGCSGLSYAIDYIDEKPETDIFMALENGKFISIDKKSFPFLKGIRIDYVKQGINHKFVFENPNQTGQCGCGESFTVDDI